MTLPDKQERALSLRRSGKKLREISTTLRVTVGRAQRLVRRATQMEESATEWTNGLPLAVTQVLRARGIDSRAALTAAIEDGSLRLMPRIGPRRYAIIRAWMAVK
jgi:hypothetical protein